MDSDYKEMVEHKKFLFFNKNGVSLLVKEKLSKQIIFCSVISIIGIFLLSI